VKLTDEQRELLEQFDATVAAGGDRHSPRARSWLDSVKSFFEKIGA
jgi:molecular chaperone DnaJ